MSSLLLECTSCRKGFKPESCLVIDKGAEAIHIYRASLSGADFYKENGSVGQPYCRKCFRHAIISVILEGEKTVSRFNSGRILGGMGNEH